MCLDILYVPDAIKYAPDGDVYYLGRHYTRARPLTLAILDAYCRRLLDTGREARCWRDLAAEAYIQLHAPVGETIP